MKIKKILIIKPKVEEFKNNEGQIIRTNYKYPKNYNAQHARHICYNFANGKNLKGSHLAEGMVIYEAEEIEIKILLQEDGIEELSYDKASIKGKQWKPKQIIDGQEKKEFDIKNWIKEKKEISNKRI